MRRIRHTTPPVHSNSSQSNCAGATVQSSLKNLKIIPRLTSVEDAVGKKADKKNFIF